MRVGVTTFQLFARCPDAIRMQSVSLRLFHTTLKPRNDGYVKPEPRLQEQRIPSRIHIIGVGNIGGFLAHSLAGDTKRPPVTLLLHNQKTLERWEKNRRRITLVRNGLAEHRWGFDINVKRDGVWHYVPQDSKLAREQKEAGGYPERDPLEANEEIIDNLIVASKATRVRWVLESVRHRLTPYSTIVFVHNGLGVQEQVNEHVFPDPETRPSYVFGVISHGLFKMDHFVIKHAGVGTCLFSIGYTNPLARARTENNILEYKKKQEMGRIAAAHEQSEEQQRQEGEIQKQPEDLQEEEQLQHRNDLLALHKAQSSLPEEVWASTSLYLIRVLTRNTQLVASAVPSDTFLQHQLEKLVINCIINPLTVIFDCFNGDLLYNYHISRVQRLLLLEISAVICALPELQGVPGIQARFAPDRLRTLAVSVMANTAKNVSSMLQDVRLRNPTEIKYMNGYIVKRGEELGIKCALNYMVVQMVLAREKIKLAKEFGDIPMVMEPEVAGRA
ncbi:2-dehydropantoate 2-reductase [Blastomyces dermatitidis ER-3]|uniref:2-dehydropantoate 2-reductase n=1 Tax=Ajellomyces dermatitidis (strain ER-3 / ATCC MYA-2586) TaxID=559297 RepID=A0ABP2F636_AJEDR|nr:2-dehydropantoate 2-reductase [Blastomyces dermatitidis ER-3]EEQ90826.1 2-dehydropantoate 2-reductase [Blastomyces dermatitidis ER-3]